MTILSFSSSDDQLSIFAIADIMEEKGDLNHLVLLHRCCYAKFNPGWKIERQLESLHCTLLPSHTLESADQFITQLQEACNRVKVQIILQCHVFQIVYTTSPSILQAEPNLAQRGVAGVYGMVGMVPDKSIVKDFLVTFFNEVYTL